MAKSTRPLVYFQLHKVSFSLKNRKHLKAFIARIFKTESKKLVRVGYVFCSDQELLEINRKFLRHDFYTDIITFDMSSRKDWVEGEIYISVERVRENATQFKVSFSDELHRVMFHGVLHLCGYNDQTPSQKKEMRNKEDLYITKFRLFHVKHVA